MEIQYIYYILVLKSLCLTLEWYKQAATLYIIIEKPKTKHLLVLVTVKEMYCKSKLLKCKDYNSCSASTSEHQHKLLYINTTSHTNYTDNYTATSYPPLKIGQQIRLKYESRTYTYIWWVTTR